MSPLAVDLLARALVLLITAWLVVTMLRRRSASVRALTWTVALAGVLVLPVVTAFTPSLDVPVFSAEPPVTVASAAVHEPSAAPSGSVSVIADATAAPAVTQAAWTQVEGSPRTAAAWPSLSLGEAALLLWALVALVLAIRIVISHLILARLAHVRDRALDEHTAEWRTRVDEARARLGIRRQVRVRLTQAIGVPAVAGVLRPVLLLPAEAHEWNADMQRAVVLHELAHVARWDAMGQLISQLACAAYWCVPLVWHGARRAAVLREQASDDVVLMSGMRASTYAENLLHMARLTGNTSLEPATLAMAHPHRIKERIMAILDPVSAREGLRAHSRSVVGITAAAIITLVAVVQPTAKAALLVTTQQTAGPVAPVGPAGPAGPVERVEPGEPVEPVEPEQARPCERELKHNSSSQHDDGRSKWWTVKMSGPDCTVDMRVDGTVEFNDTFTDVKSLSNGGNFRLDVREGGVRRELEIEQRGGSLTRLYRVDGREQTFDDAGRAWFGAFLIALDRRTAVGVDYRLPVLLKQGGVAAVLKETALMTGDHPRSRYYEKLIEARQLNDGERAQVLQQTAALVKSDHYASTLLSAIGKAGFEHAGVRTAALAMIDSMESDHYRSTSVSTVMGAGRPTAGDMDVLVRTVERIESDHYKLEVLKRIVNGPLQAQHRAVLAKAARTVESDHYAAEFLKALSAGGADNAERQVFFDVISTIESDHYVLEVLKSLVAAQAPSRSEFQAATRTLAGIESDHYRTEAIRALLSAREITEADLLSLLSNITSMDSDHYKSESLRHLAQHRAATDRVRTAVIDAADRMSSHYREQVRRAAGRD